MLPRLLYVGDVPVEATCHGSALLHRLLADYPPGKLTILETGGASDPARRLPDVNYISHPIGKKRWLNTRFHPYATAWYSQAGSKSGTRILRSLNGHGFESVLTVAHGFGWLAAAAVADLRNARLHLMVHDDWPRIARVPGALREWLDGRFGEIYRQAKSRLCVSPAMSRVYCERYGEAAAVIYPGRAPECPDFENPPERLGQNGKAFTVAFAGTINSKGYVKALVALQETLKPIDGRLLLFGPLTAAAAAQLGLDDSRTRVCGLLSSSNLIERLREEADALFVPMSFDSSERTNMEMAFPSKLADYTATGLPLLIYGPNYCSAVGWAREHAGVAEIAEGEMELVDAVNRLAKDPGHRVSLGGRALEIGRHYFDRSQIQQVFNQALSS